MFIKTKPGKPTVLKLSAYERRILDNAQALASDLAAHSDGDLLDASECLRTVFYRLFEVLDQMQPAEGPTLPLPDETADVPSTGQK